MTEARSQGCVGEFVEKRDSRWGGAWDVPKGTNTAGCRLGAGWFDGIRAGKCRRLWRWQGGRRGSADVQVFDVAVAGDFVVDNGEMNARHTVGAGENACRSDPLDEVAMGWA